MLRTQRPVPLLASDGAESYPAGPMMFHLCLFSSVVGCSTQLFQSVGSKIEADTGFSMGTFDSIRAIFVCFGSLLWGSMASRGSLTRKQILVIGALFAGLITAVTWFFVSNYIVLLFLRAMDGFFLSTMVPVTYSIVGDRFDDASRGKWFGLLMMSEQAGSVITNALTQSMAPPVGWAFMFFFIGGAMIIVAAEMQRILVVPPVKVCASSSNLQSVCQILKRSSFQILVLQGCFGVIPWAALNYRGLFFQWSGINKGQISEIFYFASYVAVFSSFLGGLVGDSLNSSRPLHGRVLAAQITVFAGIPIAFVTFMISPIFDPFSFYLIMTVILVLMTTWTPSACNNPILCSLAREDERSLIFAFTGVLSTVVIMVGDGIGSVMLTYILAILGYDASCSDPAMPGCGNSAPIGQAIFVTCCIGWVGSGLLYSLLHRTYPKDIETIQAEREVEANAGNELAGAPQV